MKQELQRLYKLMLKHKGWVYEVNNLHDGAVEVVIMYKYPCRMSVFRREDEPDYDAPAMTIIKLEPVE